MRLGVEPTKQTAMQPHSFKDEPLNITVGRNLRVYRVERHISREVFATKCNLTLDQLDDMENGTNRLWYGIVFEICDCLAIEPRDLFRSWRIV